MYGQNEPWKEAVISEWKKRRGYEKSVSKISFPLISNTTGEEELIAMVDTLLSTQLTLGPRVKEFEDAFARWVGAPYACMVNSGSSANLLAIAVACNPERKVYLRTGDEVLVPAVCWSTSVFPLMQNGLKPVFVDCDPRTMNMDLADMKRKITKATKGVVLVHVLGNSCPMEKCMDLCREHGLIVVEDTCESLGSLVRIHGAAPKYLGTLGDFGSYSFYYSHHLTSGEGGMVVCNTVEDYNLVRCLRAHGWSRHRLDVKECDARHPEIDSRFNFVNVGFNLRPLEVQAAMALVQLKDLQRANQQRRDNFKIIHDKIYSDPRYKGQFKIFEPAEGCDPAWFGLACLLDASLAHQQKEYLTYLSANAVENRPVISGNFARQPVLKLYDIHIDPHDLPGSEVIHQQGFFIGSHNQPISPESVDYLVEVLLSFPFCPQEKVLVTGATGLAGSAVQRLVAKVLQGSDESLSPEVKAFVSKASFTFIGSGRADLRDLEQCKKLFRDVKPQYVLHLAGALSGIQTMANAHTDYYSHNSRMNSNVLKCAAELRVKKVVSCLSTVMLPAEATYPVTEAAIHTGPPNPTGYGYAAAKRELDLLSRWTSAETETKCVCLLPSNMFGPGGDFSVKDGPVAHALIRKAIDAKAAGGNLPCFGTGKPLRQMLFSDDLAKLLVWALACYDDTKEPVNVAGPEISVKELAETIASVVGFEGALEWSGDMDGALRRTADTTKFVGLYGSEPQWTPLRAAIEQTVRWYANRSNQARIELS